MVLMDGEVTTSAACHLDAPGYDLMGLVVGSEGTAGHRHRGDGAHPTRARRRPPDARGPPRCCRRGSRGWRWPWPRVRRRLARRPADHRPDAVAARRGGARRGRDLRADGLRPRLERASGLRGTVTVNGDQPSCAPTRRTPTGSPRPPGRAAGWSSTGWSEVAPGVYRTTEPMPLDGEWKTMIRLHRGTALTRAAGLSARRPGDPGRGHPGAAADRARASGPSSSCSSASARPTSAGWLWARRVRRRAGDRARRSSPRSPGACTASRSARPARRGRQPRSPVGGPPSTSTSSSSASATAVDDHREPAAQDRLRQPLADHRAEQRADAGRAAPASR